MSEIQLPKPARQGPWPGDLALYSESQMRAMYQQGYAAALSQTAGVVVDADEVLVPWDECYSIDGDSWCDSPADAGFVDGLKVGDTYDLIVSHWSITRTYVVTKAPDETSDDYEVEPVAAPAASGADTSTNEAWAARAQEKIAAMDAAASVSERARELLAAEYSKCGMQQCAADIRAGVFAAAQQLAVNAIKAALEHKAPSGEIAIVCDWSGADPFPTFIEAEVGGKSVSLKWRDRPDGLKELIVPLTDSTLEQALTQQRGESSPVAEVRGYGDGGGTTMCWTAGKLPVGTKLYTTPQPGAEALRELVRRILDWQPLTSINKADRLYQILVAAGLPFESVTDELESLLGRGGK